MATTGAGKRIREQFSFGRGAMNDISAISLFCPYMHTDKDNSDTLVSIYPDNVEIPQAGVTLPVLANYTRIQFDPHNPPKNLELQFRDPENAVIISNKVASEVVEKAVSDGLRDEQPRVSLILRMNAVGFTLQKLGRYSMWFNADGTEKLCGTLNIKVLQK
jgi:hypothetical protein